MREVSSIVNAARVNQEGAMHLNAGHIGLAASWFAQALELVSVPFSFSSLHDTFPVATIHSNVRRNRGIRESRGFLYSKPFFFTQEALASQDYATACVAVMAFNLALTYHLEGLTLVDGGRYLMKAKRIYETSLGLLCRQQQCDCSNVIIALLNNLACLNAELFCFHESHQMLLLLTILVKEGRITTNTIDVGDFSDVILNIRVLLMPTCAGAA